MDKKKTIVAVLIVNYNGKRYLDDCLRSLEACSSDFIEQVVYIVDNNSQDGSAEYIRSQWPAVRVVISESNRGYAGGNNLGWERILRDHPDIPYIFLLNQDTLAGHNFLDPLVAYMNSHPGVGAVQPKLMLHPDTHKINSLGNVIHYLGFGYSSYNGFDESTAKISEHAINYASGAAVLLRTSAVKAVGLFDDFMFMYLEDLDLGWKLFLTGWESVMVPGSTVYHKYEFSSRMKLYYYFERNRLWILLKNYKIATLVILFPAWLFMEIGQIARAFVHGTAWQKLRSYGYFVSLNNIRTLRCGRRKMQRMRTRSDREILRTFSGSIDFQPIASPILRHFVNPVLNGYFFLMKMIVFW